MALAGIVASFDGAGPDPVLRPETWVGRHFPIAGNVSFAGQAVDLDDGEWLVVFYDDSCSHCRVLIPSILRWCEGDATTPVAFVAVTPPTAPRGGLVPPRRSRPGIRVVSGQLDDSRTWFVRTPSLVHLVDGVVSPGGWPPRFLELAEGRG